MVRLFSLTVVKNEADRYLDSVLDAASQLVDEVFVYDDQSSDDTLDIVRRYTKHWWVREGGPSFLEHEGQFRQAAWDAFEDCCQPQVGDWVLALDADEILVAMGGASCVRSEVDDAMAQAENQGAMSVRVPIPEIFGLDNDGTPLVRTDGWWARIAGHVLFKYQPHGIYRDKAMGAGREPSYVATSPISNQHGRLRLLHYGYADKADQVLKHERYTALLDHGHNDRHVQSIVQAPTLERWNGPTPRMQRGSSGMARAA